MSNPALLASNCHRPSNLALLQWMRGQVSTLDRKIVEPPPTVPDHQYGARASAAGGLC